MRGLVLAAVLAVIFSFAMALGPAGWKIHRERVLVRQLQERLQELRLASEHLGARRCHVSLPRHLLVLEVADLMPLRLADGSLVVMVNSSSARHGDLGLSATKDVLESLGHSGVLVYKAGYPKVFPASVAFLYRLAPAGACPDIVPVLPP